MEIFFYGVIALVVVAVGVVFIYVMMEFRATLKSARDFIKSMEERLNPLIEDSSRTLESLRLIADDIRGMVEDVKVFSRPAMELAKGLADAKAFIKYGRELAKGLEVLGLFVTSISRLTTVQISAVRAGIKTAFDVFKKGLLKKGNKSS